MTTRFLQENETSLPSNHSPHLPSHIPTSAEGYTRFPQSKKGTVADTLFKTHLLASANWNTEVLLVCALTVRSVPPMVTSGSEVESRIKNCTPPRGTCNQGMERRLGLRRKGRRGRRGRRKGRSRWRRKERERGQWKRERMRAEHWTKR